MNTRVNRSVLAQRNWDSGALAGTLAVVHPVGEPGTYVVTLLRGDAAIGEQHVVVDPDSETTQIDIDLASSHQPSPARVSPEGYLVFHSSSVADQLAATVEAVSDEARRRVYDTRTLNRGDVLGVTLLRPGRYRMTNRARGGEGTINVSYPRVGDRAYSPPEPLDIAVFEQGFEPNEVELQPLQGLRFQINASARVQIDLIEPNDGPQREERQPKIRWRRIDATTRDDTNTATT